ncbi:MAG: polysaccharide pyruvyl transferase family protein [Pseudomonadota bacterium]
MNKNKISLLGATFNTRNMGVGALTAGAVKCIIQRFPDAEIDLLDYDYKCTSSYLYLNDKKIPLRLVNMRFSKKIYLPNNIVVLLVLSLLLKLIINKNLKEKIIRSNFCLNSICESQIAVSIAGGDSFSDIYGIGRFLYVSLPQLLVLLLGKDLVMLPQTIGPFKSRFAKSFASYILNRAKMIYSRDHESLKELRELPGLCYSADRFKFCYDVGFILDAIRPKIVDIPGMQENVEVNTVIVGLNISGLLYMGGYTKNNMFELRVNYQDLVYKMIDFILKNENIIIVLVPHVFGSHDHLESDSTVCERIYEDLKVKYSNRIAYVRGSYNQNEIKYIIGMCDFFIGSRMHACIAALSQTIPTVSIAYSRKFIGVMETIGAKSLVADPRTLEIDDILKIIDETFSKRDAVKKHLEETMPYVRETVLNLFYDIESSRL